jgi:S1-C subfamily serine protease
MNATYRLTALLMGTTVMVAQPFCASAVAQVSVGRVAKDVTVFIQGVNSPDNFGSGVIIGHSGKTYSVLTASHVVANADQYTIQTSDGVGNTLKSSQKLSGIDMAVVQFESSATYAIAALGNSDQVEQTDGVFVAGFAKPGANITVPILQITKGDISSLIPNGQAKDGYGLAYTNPTRAGMSGGPVFNVAGEVVGIHGRKESESSGGATNGAWLNLGIPINRYKAGGAQIAGGANPDNRKAQADAKQQAALKAQQQADQLKAQQESQRQAALKAQQEESQRQAALNKAQQEESKRQAALKAQQQNQQAQQQAQADAKRQAALKAQQQADQLKVQADAKRQATHSRLANLRPLDAPVARSSGAPITRQVCEDKDVRVNTIVVKRKECHTVTVPQGNESSSGSSSGNEAENYVNTGNSRIASGSYKDAVSSYDDAIQRNPSLAVAFFNRGLAYYNLGQRDNAIADFSKAAALFRSQGDGQKLQQTQDILQALNQANS